jgi:rare lipoprotein A
MRRGMGWRWGAALALAGALGGCAVFRAPAPPPVRDGVQTGIASWYGPGFHGRRTANGEVYDQYEMTAAHPSLPLGTRVMVTNLDNGRTVEVRINDRGPFVGGRVIDLSYAAAHAVQMVGPGLASVRIEVLPARSDAPLIASAAVPPPVPRPPASALAPPRLVPRPVAEPMGTYVVEVATLRDAARAEHLRQVLAGRFPDAFVSRTPGVEGDYHRVRVGPYPLRTHALARAERLGRLGYPAIIVEDATP